jgi:hypothetical protein
LAATSSPLAKQRRLPESSRRADQGKSATHPLGETSQKPRTRHEACRWYMKLGGHQHIALRRSAQRAGRGRLGFHSHTSARPGPFVPGLGAAIVRRDPDHVPAAPMRPSKSCPSPPRGFHPRVHLWVMPGDRALPSVLAKPATTKEGIETRRVVAAECVTLDGIARRGY